MPVEVVDVCSVFAHEVRTPLGALQGYLRLLQTHDSGAPAPILKAMLEATSQLAALGRQASALGLALEQPAGRSPVEVTQLAERLRRLRPVHECTTSPLISAQMVRATGDGSALADALVALADAVAREAEAVRAHVAFSEAAGPDLLVDIVADPPGACTSGRVAVRRWFLLGGYGLGLLHAAATLDAHDVRVDVLARCHLRLHVPTRDA
jgi:signal transduction histidine kinase